MKKQNTIAYLDNKNYLANNPYILDVVRDIDLDSIYKKDDRFYLKDHEDFYFKERQRGLYQNELCILNNIEVLTLYYGKTEEEALKLLQKFDDKFNLKPLPYMLEKPKVHPDSLKYLFDSFAASQRALDKKENDKLKIKALSYIGIAVLFMCITTGLCNSAYTISSVIHDTIDHTTETFDNMSFSNDDIETISDMVTDTEIENIIDENNLSFDNLNDMKNIEPYIEEL